MGMGVLTVFDIRQQATSAIYADVRTTTLMTSHFLQAVCVG